MMLSVSRHEKETQTGALALSQHSMSSSTEDGSEKSSPEVDVLHTWE